MHHARSRCRCRCAPHPTTSLGSTSIRVIVVGGSHLTTTITAPGAATAAVAAVAAAARSCVRACASRQQRRLTTKTMAAAARAAVPPSHDDDDDTLTLTLAAETPEAADDFRRRFRAVEGHGPVRLVAASGGDAPPSPSSSSFDSPLFFRTLAAARPAALRAEELAAMALPSSFSFPALAGGATTTTTKAAATPTPPAVPFPRSASDLRAGTVLLHARRVGSTQEFMRAHSSGPLALAAQAAAQAEQGRSEPSPLLPEGAALVADVQAQGKGRGGNAWASPGGCLMFTVLRSLRVPGDLAPFINYAVCLAVVEGAREAAYEAAAEALRRRRRKEGAGGSEEDAAADKGEEDEDDGRILKLARAAADALPLRVKWPNDIYCSWDGPLGGSGGDGGAGAGANGAAAPSPSPSLQAIRDPSDPTGALGKPPVVKIGGALIHTTFSGGGRFSVLTGVGLNVSNRAPTTCLDALLERALQSLASAEEEDEGTRPRAARPPPPLPVAVRREALLAHVLARLDGCFASLESRGFAPLEARYLQAWLHSGQRLQLEGPEQQQQQQGGSRASGGGGGGGSGGGWGPDEDDDEDREGGRRAVVVTVAGLSPSGFLLGVDDRGGRYELTPDGNSLDMMAGLLRRRL